jgi:hypothetical protein
MRAKLLRDADLTAESTAESIRRGALFDPRSLVDADGNYKRLSDLTEQEAWCIAGFELVTKNAAAGDGHTDKVWKIKLVDRAKYVELAARHLGMLTDKVELQGELVTALTDRLTRARKRGE